MNIGNFYSEALLMTFWPGQLMLLNVEILFGVLSWNGFFELV